MRTFKTLLLAGLVLVPAILAAMPTATAQQSSSTTVACTPPSEPVKPLQAPLNFQCQVTYVADYSALTGIIGIPVTYSVSKQPAWGAVLVSPATDVFPAPSAGAPSGGSYSVTRQITVTVSATDQAPAFAADTIEITATPGTGAGGRSTPGKGSVTITAGYFSIVDVQLTEAIKIARPQTPVVFPVKVSNFGNANTKVTFDITDKTENLNVPIPNPITLQSKQAGGNQVSADVPLTIQTPYKNGYLNEVGVVNYKLSSAYALDPKIRGDESSVSLLVTTRGFYVPGPGPLMFLGVLAIAALLLARRRA